MVVADLLALVAAGLRLGSKRHESRSRAHHCSLASLPSHHSEPLDAGVRSVALVVWLSTFSGFYLIIVFGEISRLFLLNGGHVDVGRDLSMIWCFLHPQRQHQCRFLRRHFSIFQPGYPRRHPV